MMAAPQFLIEGVAITSFAIGCNHAFIYLRGEVVHVYRRLLRAVEEAYAAGHLGKNIHGSGFDLDVTVHAGAGAYICGEETALLDSPKAAVVNRAPSHRSLRSPGSTPAQPSSTMSSRSRPCRRSCCTVPTGSHMGTQDSTGFGIFSLGSRQEPRPVRSPDGHHHA